MLEVRDLSCVRGDHRLFANLAFTLRAGELLHLRGHNGSGKTSLIRTLCGLTMPDEGDVLWNGKDIRGQRDEYNRILTYFGHHGAIKGDLTAYENLVLSCQMTGIPVNEDRLLKALVDMGLAGREDLPTKVLSQGQKRRVALARLLVVDSELWILDEPFTALDVKAVQLLMSVLADQLQRGGLVLLTTHQEVNFGAVPVKTIELGEC